MGAKCTGKRKIQSPKPKNQTTGGEPAVTAHGFGFWFLDFGLSPLPAEVALRQTILMSFPGPPYGVPLGGLYNSAHLIGND